MLYKCYYYNINPNNKYNTSYNNWVYSHSCRFGLWMGYWMRTFDFTFFCNMLVVWAVIGDNIGVYSQTCTLPCLLIGS